MEKYIFLFKYCFKEILSLQNSVSFKEMKLFISIFLFPKSIFLNSNNYFDYSFIYK